jgi:hypothetical protein
MLGYQIASFAPLGATLSSFHGLDDGLLHYEGCCDDGRPLVSLSAYPGHPECEGRYSGIEGELVGCLNFGWTGAECAAGRSL